MRMEDQFNALLYLGAPSSMTDGTDAGRALPGRAVRENPS